MILYPPRNHISFSKSVLLQFRSRWVYRATAYILRTCLLFSVVYSRCGPITQCWAPVARGPGEEAVYITLYSPLLFCSVYIYTDSNIKAIRSMYRYTCPFVTTACILRPYIYPYGRPTFPSVPFYMYSTYVFHSERQQETLYSKWVLSDYIYQRLGISL
jgi:hypothetical protein